MKQPGNQKNKKEDHVKMDFLESREFFEQMFLQSSISTQILDKDGWCLRVNPKLCELFGVEAHHIEGGVYNIFKDEAIIQGGVLPHLEKVFQKGEPVSWEVHFDIGIASESQNIPVKQKKKTWFRNWAFPLFDKDGKLKHVIIQHADITQEKEMIESLKNSDRIFQHALDMLCIAGMDGYFKVLNPSWSRVLGWSEEELMARPWLSFLHPDDVDATKAIGERLTEGINAYQFENRYICKDGTVKWLSWNSFPYLEEGILYGVARDITEKIKEEQVRKISYEVAHAAVFSEDLEALIRQIYQYMSTLVETSNFYIALFDETSGLFTIPYERDEKDRIGSWPADRSATGLVVKRRASLLLKKEDVNQLIKDGIIDMIGTPSEVWLGVPLFEEEKVIGVLALQSYDNPNAFDANTLSILEFVSGQISMAIQKKRIFDEMVKAKNKAEESDRLKTAFLNNLSHEIRTPLNAIVGFSQFLNEKGLEADQVEHITGIICRSSDQLLSIISDIISISTIEAGIMELNPRQTDINAILKNVYEQLQIKAVGKGLSLRYHSNLSPEEAQTIADETKLNQILSNLVDNAIKFTHVGHVEFGCSIKEDRFRFFVIDTGIGIDEELHNTVFERFHQIEVGKSSSMGGLGLGLPLARSFVELMQGKIWLDSSPGKGSRFYFSIPRIMGNAPKMTKDFTAAPQTIKKNTTILVAEDEENNYELTKTILAMVGVDVLHAWDGQQAVDLCNENTDIDMVLMDIKMPIMNGYEATRQIKQKRPDLPIVALTAYALVGDREKALNAGCDDYMAKPVSLDLFHKLIQKYLH